MSTPPRAIGAANHTALLATMIGCEPLYSVLSGILQPDVTPPDITAVSVAAACGGIDSETSKIDMRVSVRVSQPAEVCNCTLHVLRASKIAQHEYTLLAWRRVNQKQLHHVDSGHDNSKKLNS